MVASIGTHTDRYVSRKVTVSDRRRKLIAAVHAAVRKLKLDEDTRRDVYRRVTQKESLTDMNLAQIGQVLDELNVEARGLHQEYRTAWARKARALWITAYWCGIIDDQRNEAMDAFITRQTGIQKRQWITGDKGHSVIEALKAMLSRHGFTTGWSSGDNPGYYYARELFNRCRAHLVVEYASLEEFAHDELGLEAAPVRGLKQSAYSVEECNRIIAYLGAIWRAQQGKALP